MRKWLVRDACDAGDHAALARDHGSVPDGDIAFYLGCIHLTPPDVLTRNRENLVVHESDLPADRGFSPLTWNILEGRNRIPVCLLHMADEADAGPVVYRETLTFAGDELIDELRHEQGRNSAALCLRYLNESAPLEGDPQQGTPSARRRRTAADSRLDPDRTIGVQFNLLRVVDNERYPLFFDRGGHRYRLKIEKIS